MNFLPGNKTDSMWIQLAGSFLNLYHWANFLVLTKLLEPLTAASGVNLRTNDDFSLTLVVLWTRGSLESSCTLSVLHMCNACYTQCNITHTRHANLSKLHVPCKPPSTTHSLCHLISQLQFWKDKKKVSTYRARSWSSWMHGSFAISFSHIPKLELPSKNRWNTDVYPLQNFYVFITENLYTTSVYQVCWNRKFFTGS